MANRRSGGRLPDSTSSDEPQGLSTGHSEWAEPREGKGDMDLWDVAKVMWRRRGVTVPLLLLSAIAAVFALLTIPPGYSAKAQIAFLAPPAAAPGQAANPFTVGGLAEFLSITLNRQEIRQQVIQDSLSADYQVTFKSEGLPLIGLEVVGQGTGGRGQDR